MCCLVQKGQQQCVHAAASLLQQLLHFCCRDGITVPGSLGSKLLLALCGGLCCLPDWFLHHSAALP